MRVDRTAQEYVRALRRPQGCQGTGLRMRGDRSAQVFVLALGGQASPASLRMRGGRSAQVFVLALERGQARARRPGRRTHTGGLRLRNNENILLISEQLPQELEVRVIITITT